MERDEGLDALPTATALRMPRLAYRPAQAAEALGCSTDTIFRLLASGELNGFKVNAARFISGAELLEFVRRRERDGRVAE